MTRFRISNFEREHPGIPFPPFSLLSPGTVSQLRRGLARRLGLSGQLGRWRLLRTMFNQAEVIDQIGEDASHFDLAANLQQFGVVPGDQVYLMWDDFDTINGIDFVSLSRYFDDIWYPSADDIEIFDDTLDWVAFVTHYGEVRLLSVPHFPSDGSQSE